MSRTPYLRIRTAYGTRWVGSPVNTTTDNPNLAATWRLSERAEAELFARDVEGVVEVVYPDMDLAQLGETLLSRVTGPALTRAQYAALALACCDQAGLSAADQAKVAAMLLNAGVKLNGA